MMGAMNLKVDVDKGSGFCFGVVYAIQMAEELLEEHGKLFCLGDIVHNDEEVKRLEAKGLTTITHDDLPNLHNERVLIRAHGEPPSTYQLAAAQNIELVDASCPVVLKLQQRVRNAHDSETPIFIYGKHGHPEVQGLIGQTGGKAVVFQTVEELMDMPLPPELTLFTQTTKDMRTLYSIKDQLEEKGIKVNFNDTLCRQVSNRDVELRTYVKNFDKIVFVAGRKSSNGKVLYNICKEHNEGSFFISNTAELQPEWFSPGDSVGICGATSTPLWLMEEVAAELHSL